MRLDLLVISDFHYVRRAESFSSNPERKTRHGIIFLKKALQRLKYENIQPDAILINGDIVDEAGVEHADDDLRDFAAAAKKLELPILAVPGNHDGQPKQFGEIFNCPPGLHILGQYGFFIFHDQPQKDETVTRSQIELAQLQEVHELHPEMPLIALQHNPVHPKIESFYPYNPANSAEIVDSYAKNKVILSLSSHYHHGQPAHKVGEVMYYTVPAICEAPYRFAHVRLEERSVKITEHRLQLEVSGLTDVHCHTEYAYCGHSVEAKENLELTRMLGLSRLCLTEHSFQLYFEKDFAWSYKWQRDPDSAWQMIERGGRRRMLAYKVFIEQFRVQNVLAGLEVDLLADGDILLADEDRNDWDLLVGSIHQIPGVERGQIRQAEAERLFMREVERLAHHPIQVMAHPFRFLRRNDFEIPVELYRRVAKILAARGIAAEINFHINTPDPHFFEICLEENVKIALGTDSHKLEKVAELTPHLRLLRQIGVREKDYEDVLFGISN